MFKVVGEGGSPLKSGGGVLRKQASQSLRGVPALPTTRCSCVLISANNNAGLEKNCSFLILICFNICLVIGFMNNGITIYLIDDMKLHIKFHIFGKSAILSTAIS